MVDSRPWYAPTAPDFAPDQTFSDRKKSTVLRRRQAPWPHPRQAPEKDLDQQRRHHPRLAARVPRREGRRNPQVLCRRGPFFVCHQPRLTPCSPGAFVPQITTILTHSFRKAYGELPDTAKINETDTFGPGEDGDCGFEFDEDRDSDSDVGGNAGGSKEIEIDDI